MKRFYNNAMNALKNKLELDELHDDIQYYVGYLEHCNNVLLSELSRVQPNNTLLKQKIGR